MKEQIDDIITGLPPEIQYELLPSIREEFLRSAKTVVVLDDDPTGTQTCYDVVVLTSWRVPLLIEELKKGPSILFILTNSRSLPEAAAIVLATEIGNNLTEAVKESGRDIAVISRSDSTLRGHYPAEVDAVATALNIADAVRVIIPAFIEGGRFTINDVHYILEEGQLIPVSETPFAKDTVFGYANSDLKRWVEEKTRGQIRPSAITSISIEDIRTGGPEHVAGKFSVCAHGEVCIVNACSHKDLEVVVMGLLLAEKRGQRFIYRTSATFVSIRAGIPAGRIFKPGRTDTARGSGSLMVVGSYVPKTTRQLEHLLSQGTHEAIEINVSELLRLHEADPYQKEIVKKADQLLAAGKNVAIHTSRKLESGTDAESSLQINTRVSFFLVGILKRLSVRPEFIIAKGGITSSDLATRGLGAEKALVLGQIIPGVPVWKMDTNSKFPDIIYVVFPGNVGDDAALSTVYKGIRL